MQRLLSARTVTQSSYTDPLGGGCPAARFELWLCQKGIQSPWTLAVLDLKQEGLPLGQGNEHYHINDRCGVSRGRYLAKLGDSVSWFRLAALF